MTVTAEIDDAISRYFDAKTIYDRQTRIERFMLAAPPCPDWFREQVSDEDADIGWPLWWAKQQIAQLEGAK
jgi:hypothetical protein